MENIQQFIFCIWIFINPSCQKPPNRHQKYKTSDFKSSSRQRNHEILWIDLEPVDLDNLEIEQLIEEEELTVITNSNLINSFKDIDC